MCREICEDDIVLGAKVIYNGKRSFNGIFCDNVYTIDNIILSGFSKCIILKCKCGDTTIEVEENEIALKEDYHILEKDNTDNIIIKVKEDKEENITFDNTSLLEKRFKKSLWKHGMKKRR